MSHMGILTSKQVNKDYYLAAKYVSLERFISYFYQTDLIRQQCPQNILFIGVGDAMVPTFLKKQFGQDAVVTLDIDPDLSPDCVGDIRSLPFQDNTFDLVVAFEVIEHLPFGESEKALAELSRVSKSYVLLSVPHRRTGFEFVFKFPLIRSVLKKSFVGFKLLWPVRFPGFAISKQHHWEIDGFGLSLKNFRNVLSRNFKIEREFTPVLSAYQRFFVLRKIK